LDNKAFYIIDALCNHEDYCLITLIYILKARVSHILHCSLNYRNSSF